MTDRDASSDNRLGNARRVVIKIGSSLLVEPGGGGLHKEWLSSLLGEVARFRERDQQIMLVSSGAIALGRRYLGLAPDQRRLEQLQAAAASGQVLLAQAYQDLLAAHGVPIAQVLLTPGDTEDRRRYLNARNTLQELLSLGAVPVINENDTVATQEIRYGDNDRLAARVAEMVSADCLVLLSDVDGLYDADPATCADAKLIPQIKKITPAIEAAAGMTRTEFGSGGMVTKLAAARMCMSAGCATVIASGRRMNPLAAIEAGHGNTWFLPSSSPMAARKQWIAGSLRPRGTLIIDAGAHRALMEGSSLLPVGIVSVNGQFGRGDAVNVENSTGQVLARGLTAYSSDEVAQILGQRSSDIERLLGYGGRDEVIHRDNLVIMDG